MKMKYHGNDDWCHICGERHYATVDIFYPENAEHGNDDRKYVRICSQCIQRAMHIIATDSPSVWRVGFAGELKAADDHLGRAVAMADGKIPARHMDKLLRAKRNIHLASVSA